MKANRKSVVVCNDENCLRKSTKRSLNECRRDNVICIYIYNTARYFPRFPLDGLVVYIVHINGLFIYLHESSV